MLKIATFCRSLANVAVVTLLFSTLTANAANGTWTGAESGLWTNSANWSALTYPGSETGETATFTGAGNGNTIISLDSLARIFNVTFGAAAAGYTLGAGGANGQTLVLEGSGAITMNNTVANSQTVDATVLLGTNTATASYTFQNDNIGQTLTISGSVAGAAAGGTAGSKTLNLSGYGRIRLNGVLSNGGATALALNSYGTNTLSGDNTFTGNIVVYDGTLRLTHSNALGTGTKTVTAANNANGRNPSVVLDGSAGGLAIPANVTFNTSNARAGAVINEAGTNTILGNFTLTSGDGNTHIWSKGGKLTIAGNLAPTATLRQLYLRGDADGEISGVIANGTTVNMPVIKDAGTGIWTLSGANTFSGSTTVGSGTLTLSGANGSINASTGVFVNAGATLLISNTGADNHANRLKDSAPVVMASATLIFANDAADANFSETTGPLILAAGNNTVSTSRAAEGKTATLTLSGLSSAAGSTVNFTGAGLGSNRNRIFITGQADGPIGNWATVDIAAPALYSAALGVYTDSAVTDIAARGDTIVNAADSNVRINSEGTSGPNALSDTVTAVNSLAQNTDYSSAVNTADKTFKVGSVSIAADKADLTLGLSPNDGTVEAHNAGGTLTLVNSSTNTLTLNATITDNASPSSLTKLGSGAAVLAGTNSFSGLVSVQQGYLLLKGSLALQSALLGTSGVVFDSSVTPHAFTLGNLTNSFALSLADNATNPITLSVGNNSASSAFGGTLSSSGSLHKVGSGTLTLTGTSTYNGGTQISGGKLATGVAGGLGAGPVTNSAILNLTAGNVTYTALGTSLSGTGTVNVTLGTGSNNNGLSGDYSAFTGVWNLGVTGVGGKVTMNGADNAAATINVLSNATVYVSAAGTHNATVVLNGGDTGEAYGQLRLEGSANWAGPVKLASAITDPADGFFGNNGGTGIVSGVISDLVGGPYLVEKRQSGVLIFSGSNTYAGATWVRGGSLIINSLKNFGEASALGAATAASNNIVKLGNSITVATLSYVGTGDTSDRVIDLAGTTGSGYLEQSGTGLLKLTSDLSVSGTGAKSLYLQGSSSGSGEFAGLITNGSGSAITVYKQGSGTWTLSRANSHSGGTTVNTGKLVAAHPKALGLGTVSFIGSFGILELANDGVGEPPYNITIGVNNSGTIQSGVAAGDVGINHTMGDLSLSQVTLTVARASSVLSGSPSITARSLNLSGGNAYTTMITPTTADLILGDVGILSGAYSKTLRLDGTSAGNKITGTISNGLGTVILLKDNTSTWTLSGSNTYSGATTINKGLLGLSGEQGCIAGSSGITLNPDAYLCLSNTAAANHASRLRDAAAVTLTGGTLDFAHSAGAADYSETVGAVTLSGTGSTISASRAESVRTSALTLTSLTRSANATINFSGTGLGEDARNRILIGAQPVGMIGFWATCNGVSPALYSTTLGVYDGALIDTEIAAKGPSTIPNNAAANARITTAGDNGPITLAGAPLNSVALLQQATATPAVVATAGKTLLTHGVAINAGQESLTLGETEGDGALTALADGGKLELVNDASTLLTVNAAISNNASSVTLAKNGLGDVLLKGACSYSGDTLIGSGSLNFSSSTTQALVGVISGPGDLIKTGTNILTLAGRNTYTGITYINEGFVLAQTNQAFGSSTAGTIIASGATLDVGAALVANNLNLGAELFTVSGAGVDGKGAIVNNSATSQYAAFGRINLAGDTTFGGAQSNGRWDIRNNTPTLNMNSFTLTKVGPNMFGLTSATVNPGTGRIDVVQGTLRFESNTKMNGSATNILTIRNGASLELYQHYPQNATAWSLVLEDGANLSAVQGTGTSNTWSGPVTLSGVARFMGGGSYSHTISSDISGSGSIIKYATTTTTLSSDNSTYSGYTWITNGTLIVNSIRNVGVPRSSMGAPATPDAGTVKIGSGSTGAALVYAGAGDTTDRVLDLAGSTGGATLTQSGTGLLKFTSGISTSGSGNKNLTLSGSTSASAELAGSISNSAGGKTVISKSGTGKWILSGNNTYTGDVNIAAGTLTLSATNAQGKGSVNVASSAGDSVLNITPGTMLTGDYGLRVGHVSGGNGAVYMTGGKVSRAPAIGTDLAFSLGRVANAYGYFNMSGGNLTITRIQTGASSSGSNSVGMFRMTGGTVTFPDYILLARGVSTLSAFTLDGGIIYHTNALNNISIGYEGGRGELNITGGALESFGRPLTVRQNANSPTGIVNLCAGALSIDAFQNTAPGVALLNFMGGTLKSGANSAVFIPVSMTGVYNYGSFGSYAGGAVIDTLSRTNTVMAPIRAPTGNGVYSITLATQGSGYIGEPYVAISGTDGLGATAVANMTDDGLGSNTFKVASVTITCPGVNYAAIPTVSFVGGGTYAVAPTVDTVTLSPSTSGGLKKLGAGTLTLTAANTYTGMTTVSGGTLKLGATNALVSNAQITLAGGTLDLSGFTVTNIVSGIGTITNGTVQTVLSPAGEGVIGTDTLTLKSATLRGTYIADVAAGGSSDLIAVQGNINLSGLAFQIVNTANLSRTNTYTILTCTGSLTGTFSSNNLPENSRWRVVYLPTGTVNLVYNQGTLIRLR